MPADNAADPGVNGESNPGSSIPATTARGDTPKVESRNSEVENQEQSASSVKGIANLLGLPADVTERITADAESRKSEVESRKPEPEKPDGDAVDADEHKGETETEQEHEEGEHAEGSPFKDERVQKRISKEVRRRSKAEERADQLEQELDEAKQKLEGHARQQQPQGPQAPASKGLLGNVTNEQQLGQWEEHATTQMEWCDANADGVTVGEGNAERFVEPTEIAKYRKEMEKVLLQAPKRRQEIRDALGQRMGAVQHYDAIAKGEAPEFWDAKSEQHKQLATIGQEDEVIAGFLRDNPAVLNDPRINVLLTRYVRGYESRNSKVESRNLDPDLPESLTRKHPPIAPITADPPSRSAAPTGSKRFTEAKQDVLAGGGTEAIKRALLASREVEQGSTRNNHRLAAV